MIKNSIYLDWSLVDKSINWKLFSEFKFDLSVISFYDY